MLQVTILDGACQKVAQGTVGEVCLRGPNVTSGYLNRTEANQEVRGPCCKPYIPFALHPGRDFWRIASCYVFISVLWQEGNTAYSLIAGSGALSACIGLPF